MGWAYTGASPVSALIPGFGLWKNRIYDVGLRGHIIAADTGQPYKDDDAPLAGGLTGPGNDTELYGTQINIADNRKYHKERFRWT